MENHQFIEYPHVPGRSPYQDVLRLEDQYVPYVHKRCPKCGSRHMTIFNRTVSRNNDDRPVSGELGFRTLTVGKCLSCGAEIPIGLKFIRES